MWIVNGCDAESHTASSWQTDLGTHTLFPRRQTGGSAGPPTLGCGDGAGEGSSGSVGPGNGEEKRPTSSESQVCQKPAHLPPSDSHKGGIVTR